MIDPKSSFQPLMPLETRHRFSRLCHWKRLAASSALIYLYNANGIYNARDDRYVGPGTPGEVLYGTGNRRVTWSGEYIDSLEVSITINGYLPGRIAKLMPDVDIVIKVETGYNEYEYRVAIQNFQVEIRGQRVISRVPTNQEMTNRYVWQRGKADTTVHTRRVLDF